jgi:hypothetical protein
VASSQVTSGVTAQAAYGTSPDGLRYVRALPSLSLRCSSLLGGCSPFISYKKINMIYSGACGASDRYRLGAMASDRRTGVALFGLAVVADLVFARGGLRMLRGLLQGSKRRRLETQSTSSTTRGHGSLLVPGGMSPTVDWTNHFSSDAGAGSTCELFVRNDLQENITLCWIDNCGKLYHFRVIHHCGAISDASVSNCHLEYTTAFHAFVLLKQKESYCENVLELTPDVCFLYIIHKLWLMCLS